MRLFPISCVSLLLAAGCSHADGRSDLTLGKKLPTTFDPDLVLAKLMELAGRMEPDRPIRLLGVRAEMAMPDDARQGHSPTRSGW